MQHFGRVTQIMDCGTCPYRTSRMFCNLSPPSLEKFKAIGSNCDVSKGVTLFREQEACDEIFVLCTGQIKLFCTSKAGKRVILKVAQPGDVLGLSAMIAGARHEATAEAIESVQFKRVRKAEFNEFLHEHIEASLHASQALSLESNRALINIRRLTVSASAAGKLAAVLLNWGCGASHREGGSRFAMTLTHEELAALAGTSRETVTRTLRRFQDEQLIQIAGYSIRILSPRGLEELSG